MKGSSFSYTGPPDVTDLRFASTFPYLETNLEQFLKRTGLSAQVSTTDKGRNVELLRVGPADGSSDFRVLVTCRHHACESMASFELEGLLEGGLADTADGIWMREHVEILAVPFVDKDGVEDGDQGKNRRPHDHNRDYFDKRYPTVRAIAALVPEQADTWLQVALDLHCPWVRGEPHEDIHFVGDPGNWAELQRFSDTLESAQNGSIVFRAENNLPFGRAWNTESDAQTFSRWAATIPGITLAATLELPYATAGGNVVTAESARQFGRSIARGLHHYLARYG